MHIHQSDPTKKREIKFKASCLKETLDFFHEMGLDPISRVKAPRISYELGKIDFDIDSFPFIPPFLEIDIEHIREEGYTVESLLKKLGLENNPVVEWEPKIFINFIMWITLMPIKLWKKKKKIKK